MFIVTTTSKVGAVVSKQAANYMVACSIFENEKKNAMASQVQLIRRDKISGQMFEKLCWNAK